jgi:hypothetical protein
MSTVLPLLISYRGRAVLLIVAAVLIFFGVGGDRSKRNEKQNHSG